MMTKLKTDQALLDALREASTRSPTTDQIEKQRVSFIMGSLPVESTMTKADVKDVIARQRGRLAAG